MTENSKLIQGRTGPWEVVLGLEVHAQVASNAKLFSGAAVGFGAGPNAQVSLVDAAMPGMLPVINRRCVEQAVRTGLGLKAKINLKSTFDRKNYFYPDLPQGYQISQYKEPVVGEGEVLVELDDGSTITVGIERLHLEQDAGKSLHDQDPNFTYVDLNRAGTALMEIVSRPDMRSSAEAAAYVKKLRTILVYLGTCDGDMEKGNLRAARSRTSTRTASSSRPSSTRRAARSRFSRTAAPSTRRRACSTRTRARRAPCARRKRRTTTATSPTPTSCRSCWTRPG
jgi:aspartyl-tRNA(Asn)/glutamyl-tRNA(Gln) amidotransferase subunit B